jgi:hypothetical protein
MSKALCNARCKAPCKSDKCQKTLITQADIGRGNQYVISQPGLYCLCSDVTFTEGIAIEIAAANVTLDLGQHTILGAASGVIAVLARENDEIVKNVVVRNGRIANLAPEDTTGMFGSALSFFLAQNVTIEDVHVERGVRAALFNNVRNLCVHNLHAQGMSEDGVVLLNVRNASISDCSVSECGSIAYSIGAALGTVFPAAARCVDVQIRACSSTDTPNGIAAVNGSNIISIEKFACHNAADAVTLFGGASEMAGITADVAATVKHLSAKNVGNGLWIDSAQNVCAEHIDVQNFDRTALRLTNCANIQLVHACVANGTEQHQGIALGIVMSRQISCKHITAQFCDAGVGAFDVTDLTLDAFHAIRCIVGFTLGRMAPDLPVRDSLLRNCVALDCIDYGAAALLAARVHLDSCISNSNESDGSDGFGILLAFSECCLVKHCKCNYNNFGFADNMGSNNAFVGNCAFANGVNYVRSPVPFTDIKTPLTANSAFENVAIEKELGNRALRSVRSANERAWHTAAQKAAQRLHNLLTSQ